ncbi:MAG: hypothetical protein ACKVS9_01540 [Phycisphaerae bacterium]
MRGNSRVRALCGVEVVTVVVMFALLLMLVLPVFEVVRQRSRDTVCLTHLRELGSTVTAFAAANNGRLPGRAHPAVYRNAESSTQGNQSLMRILRSQFDPTLSDRIATCPVQSSVNPDENFSQTNFLSAHYALNNYGGPQEPSALFGVRRTSPQYYFGYSQTPSQLLAAIPNADREWLIADAWYRPRPGISADWTQEGTYQIEFTGLYLPNFAPHGPATRKTSLPLSNPAVRTVDSGAIRAAAGDGFTNTLFVDGHAAGVGSKTLRSGPFTLLYGFPGTVNPTVAAPGNAIWE